MRQFVHAPVLAVAVALAVISQGIAAEPPKGAHVDVTPQGIHVDIGPHRGNENIPPVKARDLLGVKVLNARHENLGTIEELVLDPSSGRIRYAVLTFGGFLGMGEKYFAVPWDNLKLVSKGRSSEGTVEEDHYVLDVSQDALKNAPGFDKNHWPDLANPNWNANVDKFYSTQRNPPGVQTR